MGSVIESVGWGKPALKLLSRCEKLDQNAPAVMHIRHTERPDATLESMGVPRRRG
jgi:hypothetical protein